MACPPNAAAPAMGVDEIYPAKTKKVATAVSHWNGRTGLVRR
jgi:hypothetical protein